MADPTIQGLNSEYAASGSESGTLLFTVDAAPAAAAATTRRVKVQISHYVRNTKDLRKVLLNVPVPNDNTREKFVKAVRTAAGDSPFPDVPLDAVVPLDSKVYVQVFIGRENKDDGLGNTLPPIDSFTPSSQPRYLLRIDKPDGKLADFNNDDHLEVNPQKFIFNVLVNQPDGTQSRGVFGGAARSRVLQYDWENTAMKNFIKAKTDVYFEGASEKSLSFKITCNKLSGSDFIMRFERNAEGTITVLNQDAMDKDWNRFENLLTISNSRGMITLTVERDSSFWKLIFILVIFGIFVFVALLELWFVYFSGMSWGHRKKKRPGDDNF